MNFVFRIDPVLPRSPENYDEIKKPALIEKAPNRIIGLIEEVI